ncbi:MAG: hypothetical protein MZV64_59170 [Ignavibacteriales bacterium]|nr:hypothetical protein [Ignavibacteriales bacterium]
MSDLDTLTSAGIAHPKGLPDVHAQGATRMKVAHLKLCSAPPQIYNVLGMTGFADHPHVRKHAVCARVVRHGIG